MLISILLHLTSATGATLPAHLGRANYAATLAALQALALAILTESSLSFLGIGVRPPQASWGSMLSDAQMYIYSTPMLAFYPGALIAVTVLAINFLGDGLRDALDPRFQ